MVEPSAQRILEVWEYAAVLAPEARTRSLLSLIVPDLSQEQIGDLVLGERNRQLLELRQQLFGSVLQAYVECSQCNEALDLEFLIEDFGFTAISSVPRQHHICLGQLSANVNLPDGQVLSALSVVESIEQGRLELFSHCVQEVWRNNHEVEFSDLTNKELDALETAITELDPRMEILFDLQCPECSHEWQSPLELATFLWREFDRHARQLLENVHLLANSYGWSEADILNMSATRRQHYIERLLQ